MIGEMLAFLKQWLHRPQSVWLRKATFQIHLWTGIGLGLYVLLISVSGSAIVFRNELYNYWGKPKMVEVQSTRLTKDEIHAKAESLYPGYSITYLWESKRAGQATEIWLEKRGSKLQRLFNPYTGEDIGRAVAFGISVIAWCGNLHTNLLAGPTGRVVNGVCSVFITLLCLTGAIIWWPGLAKWRRSVLVDPKANWKRLNWELHSVIGFWTFALVFMWAFTGIYLVFPDPFQQAVNRFLPLDFYRPLAQNNLTAPTTPQPVFVLAADPPIYLPPPPDRPNNGKRRRFIPHYSKGDTILRWIYYLHFGNFAGNKTKGVWVALGLLPALLFLTGAIMWWNRVLSREARRLRSRPSPLRGELKPQASSPLQAGSRS
jgi:uncharacterized iron-regulated membrane protein